MNAHQLNENGLIINTIVVESLDALPDLHDASLGGSIGDSIIDGLLVKKPLPLIPISDLKASKNAEINAARLAANSSTFTYEGKVIACDELSAKDIDTTNSQILNTGAMPSGWVGGWKTVDNSYVAIATVADWKSFYTAMFNQGMANFAKSQALKAALASATTVEQINAIVWSNT